MDLKPNTIYKADWKKISEIKGLIPGLIPHLLLLNEYFLYKRKSVSYGSYTINKKPSHTDKFVHHLCTFIYNGKVDNKGFDGDTMDMMINSGFITEINQSEIMKAKILLGI